jgi:hypothetical protein
MMMSNAQLAERIADCAQQVRAVCDDLKLSDDLEEDQLVALGAFVSCSAILVTLGGMFPLGASRSVASA